MRRWTHPPQTPISHDDADREPAARLRERLRTETCALRGANAVAVLARLNPMVKKRYSVDGSYVGRQIGLSMQSQSDNITAADLRAIVVNESLRSVSTA